MLRIYVMLISRVHARATVYLIVLNMYRHVHYGHLIFATMEEKGDEEDSKSGEED